jgi:LCP family protein required for cell wall assembly
MGVVGAPPEPPAAAPPATNGPPEAAPDRRPAGEPKRFLRFAGVGPRPGHTGHTGRTGHVGRGAGEAGPAGAALRSAVVPGWGQWASGRRRWGLILVVSSLLALVLPLALILAVVYPLLPLLPLPLPAPVLDGLSRAGAAIAAAVGPLGALVGGADWGLLGQAAVGANLVALVFRTWAALDAAGGARRRAPAGAVPAGSGGWAGFVGRNLLPAAGGVLAAGIVIVPHLAFVGAALAARPLLAQVLMPAPAPPPLAEPAPAPTPSDPFAVAMTPLPVPDAGRPVWDGKSPLNVLLLGTDRRPREQPLNMWGNSDTILMVSVDPTRQLATMVSIPRDVLIDNIPGVGQDKVNAAYRQGGPDLAVRVVGDLLGVPIHRWASVDITAFATMIDAVGGVVVDVERPIRDDQYPTDDYNVRRILIPAGLQWLDGERALWFARSRHGSNDFDRADRQQRLLLSLKSRARDPNLVPRLPALILSLADAVQTDVSPREALTIASLGVKTDLKTVRGLVLTPPDYGREINRPDLYAIVPNRERIRREVAALLSADPAALPPAVAPTVRDLSELAPEQPAPSGAPEPPADGAPEGDARPAG